MFRAFSVFSGRNSTVGCFYHRTHRTGCARHRTHRRFSEGMGFGLQCIQCAAKRLQCVQWPRTAGTVSGFYHRTHRSGYARHRIHGMCCEGRHGFLCIQCTVADGFSVFSGQDRWHGLVLPPITQMRRKRRHGFQQMVGTSVCIGVPRASTTATQR